MKVVVKPYGNTLCADPVDMPGSPAIGLGDTLTAALGDFLFTYQEQLGVEIKVDESLLKYLPESLREKYKA